MFIISRAITPSNLRDGIEYFAGWQASLGPISYKKSQWSKSAAVFIFQDEIEKVIGDLIISGICNKLTIGRISFETVNPDPIPCCQQP